MRYPSLFEEILSLTDEEDEEHEGILKCYEITKKIAEEVNQKKSSFKKLIEIESKIEKKERLFSDSIPLGDYQMSHNARSHSFKRVNEISNEICIVCKQIINESPVKCSTCGFSSHHSCSYKSSEIFFFNF